MPKKRKADDDSEDDWVSCMGGPLKTGQKRQPSAKAEDWRESDAEDVGEDTGPGPSGHDKTPKGEKAGGGGHKKKPKGDKQSPQSKEAIKQDKEINISEQLNMQGGQVIRQASQSTGLKGLSAAALSTLITKLAKRLDNNVAATTTDEVNAGDSDEDTSDRQNASTRGMAVLEETSTTKTKVEIIYEVVKCMQAVDGPASTSLTDSMKILYYRLDKLSVEFWI